MISIIVPVYNVAPYLPQCLESLVGQTYRDIEIICVNDGSSDGSLDILESYAQKDKRIRIINQENQGLSGARNTGIAASQGEWVMFVDSDDWIDANTCRMAREAALHHQTDVVFWAYSREYKNLSLPKYYVPQLQIWSDESISQLRRRIVGPINEELQFPDTMDAWGTIWGKLYSRKYIECSTPIRFVDTKQIGSAEDVLFNIEYMARIRRAIYLPTALYHYRKERGSFTSRYNPLLSQQWDNLYDAIQGVLVAQSAGVDVQDAFSNRVAIGIIGLGLNELYADLPFHEIYRHVSALLTRPIYQSAIQKLKTQYMPIHWKVFFSFAKFRFTLGIIGLLIIIKRIVQR
ncbi:MAG: glycosyltransferase family 2 protein [bacterium]|nr:glycosyltransferase family 2 protein [bacterium]